MMKYSLSLVRQGETLDKEVPKEWKDAIAFNKKYHSSFKGWLVYELGFLSGDIPLMKAVQKSREVGNGFTKLVYLTQKYLSKQYGIAVNGKLDSATQKAMEKWSLNTIHFNQKNVPENFAVFKSNLIDIVANDADYKTSNLKFVNDKKALSSKEFSWLVLSVQHIIYNDPTKYTGRADDDFKKEVDKRAALIISKESNNEPNLSVPRAWAEAIGYNQRHDFDGWLVYELGFLSGDIKLMQAVQQSKEIGNGFTKLVYLTQKYLSKYFSLKVDGKLTEETRKAMKEWSLGTIQYNASNVLPEIINNTKAKSNDPGIRKDFLYDFYSMNPYSYDPLKLILKKHNWEDEYFRWIESILLKMIPDNHIITLVNKNKKESNKEFSWLVLSVQRAYFFDPKFHTGRFNEFTYSLVLKYAKRFKSKDPTFMYSALKVKKRAIVDISNISYNGWLIAELGFLSGELSLMNTIIQKGIIDANFPKLVKSAQKYLSKYYNLNIDGELTEQMKKTMRDWSLTTMNYNSLHVFPERTDNVSWAGGMKWHGVNDGGVDHGIRKEVIWETPSMNIKPAQPAQYKTYHWETEYFEWLYTVLISAISDPEKIRVVFKARDPKVKDFKGIKGISSKEFGWLVLTVQRSLTADKSLHTGKYDAATRYLVEDFARRHEMKDPTSQYSTLQVKKTPVPKTWTDAITYNQEHFPAFNSWQITMLGFLSGDMILMGNVMKKSGKPDEYFTKLVYKAQKYLSQSYSLKINGKLDQETLNAIQKWSHNAIQYNQNYASSAAYFDPIKVLLLKIINSDELAKFGYSKLWAGADFALLVLTVQRKLFPLNNSMHDGKFNIATRNKAESLDPVIFKPVAVPASWINAIAYNKKNIKPGNEWLIYELGFLSEDRQQIANAIASPDIGNDFTWLVYSAQKYLSRYFPLKVTGEFTPDTEQAMYKWSIDTIQYNQQHVEEDELQSIRDKLFKVATPGDYRYLFPELRMANRNKGVGNKEFSWLVLSAQRMLFGDISQHTGKFNLATRKRISEIQAGNLENYTFFVNGLVDFAPPGGSPAIPYEPYWRGAYAGQGGSEQFVDAAKSYLNDDGAIMNEKYINGVVDGWDFTTTAKTRQQRGREVGQKQAIELLAMIRNSNVEISEINFVSHSMGGAMSEGMIEEFMKHKVLKKLLEKGDIIHFSSADADGIKIASGTEHLHRTQLNYLGDETIAAADFQDGGGFISGGYNIEGVKRFGVVVPPYEKDGKRYDWHNETKWYKTSWEALRKLDEMIKENPALLGAEVRILQENSSDVLIRISNTEKIYQSIMKE